MPSTQIATMKKQLAMGQFTLTRQLLLSDQPQPQQAPAPAQQLASPQKPTKVTKVRRARQSRNPQLSVARRNERERNRVKMVNNGFARLRDHLPIEYLQQTSAGYESAGSETPDVKSPGSQSSKAKKFSKVETLRAAIKHISMLNELMRSVDPDFQMVGLQGEPQQPAQMVAQMGSYQPEDNASSSFLGFDDTDGGPMSCGADGPLSCGSSSSLLTSSSLVPTTATTTTTIQPLHQSLYQSGELVGMGQTTQSSQEHFVKIEPTFTATNLRGATADQQFHAQQQQQRVLQPAASPFDSARTTIQSAQLYSQAPAMMTQVHHTQTTSESSASEHTHLWIQQHQSSFFEQQQQQQHEQTDDQQTIQHIGGHRTEQAAASTPNSMALSPEPQQQQQLQMGNFNGDQHIGQLFQPAYYSQPQHQQQQQQLHHIQHAQQHQLQFQGQHFSSNQHSQQHSNSNHFSDLHQRPQAEPYAQRNHYGTSAVHRSAFVAL